MKFFSRDRRAVSPIIATLLLIAITVSAAIVVYVFVSGLAGNLTGGGGQQVTQNLQLQAYAFYPVGASGFTASGTSGANQLADIFLRNSGGSSVSIASVYVNGAAMTEWGSGAYTTYEQVPTGTSGCYMLVSTATTFTANTAATLGITGTTSACTGTGSACTSTNFCLVPSTTTEVGGSCATCTSPLAPQGTTQLVVALSSAQTSGSSVTLKIVSSTGAEFTFTIVAGKAG